MSDWHDKRQAVQNSLPEEAVVENCEPRVRMHFWDFLIWSRKTTILDFLLVTEIVASRSQAIKLVKQNGIRLNGKPLASPDELNRTFTPDDLLRWNNPGGEERGITLSKGKTIQHRWVVHVDNSLFVVEPEDEE